MKPENFPENSPFLECIEDDPIFEPARHLALELPEKTLSLADLGYEKSHTAAPTTIAATSCFRVLSDEGVETLYHVCKQLERFTTSNSRIARNVRGGVYRSEFLRDLALSEDICQHLSQILETPLSPHGMPHQLAHLNYQPLTPGENVDKWHWDTLQVDYVMFVTDPNTVEGGEFQYFEGTRDEVHSLKALGKALPSERITAPHIPGPGYAVLMQGDHVVHQARGIKEGERITLVNGYTYLDSSAADYSALEQLVHADPEPTVVAEYARHMALRCQSSLSSCIQRPDFNGTAQSQVKQLEVARKELDRAIVRLQSMQAEELQHFGD